MASYLQYWKDFLVARDSGEPVKYFASDQYRRRAIRPRDWIWFVGVIDGHITLLGRLRVKDVVDRDAAVRILGNRIYPARTYVIGHEEDVQAARPLVIDDLRAQLRFEGGSDRIPVDLPTSSIGRNLQAVRQLTTSTHELLLRAWNDENERLLSLAHEISDEGRDDIWANIQKTVRYQQLIERIRRDTGLVRELKGLHQNRCQLCGATVELIALQYSEAHHIVPLGGEHGGADTRDNILIVCPIHHVQLDFAAIPIDFGTLRTHSKHKLSMESIRHHNLVRHAHMKNKLRGSGGRAGW